MIRLLSMNNVSKEQPLFIMLLTVSYDEQNGVEVILCSDKEDFRKLGFNENDTEEILQLKVDEEYVDKDYDGITVKRIA